MKYPAIEFLNGKASSPNYIPKQVFQLALALIFLGIISLCFNRNTNSPLSFPKFNFQGLRSIGFKKECDISIGKWVPFTKGPYYTNATCSLIIDQQNCIKFGRPDTEFMKWRWKPDECELPLFDAVQFLELVRGKSLTFVGDSVGRNQMESLLCLLASVSAPSLTRKVYFCLDDNPGPKL